MSFDAAVFRYTIFIGGTAIMVDEALLEQQSKKFRNYEANTYLSVYPEGDIIVMDFYICINWLTKMDTNNLKQYLGEIKRTGKQNDWEKFDATVLETGTKIYQHRGRHTIIITVYKNKYIPYLIMLEG